MMVCVSLAAADAASSAATWHVIKFRGGLSRTYVPKLLLLYRESEQKQQKTTKQCFRVMGLLLAYYSCFWFVL